MNFIFKAVSILHKYRTAKSEDSSVAILTELSNHENSKIRRAVASNPNTPIEVLEKLSKEFPEIVVANSICELLLLENPDSKFIQLTLARSSTTPKAKLEKLINHYIEHQDYLSYLDIIFAAIANTNTTLEILEKLIKGFADSKKSRYFDLAIARNPNLQLKLFSLLKEH